jgi:hypothetical protein
MVLENLNFKTDSITPKTSFIYYIIKICNSKIIISIMQPHFIPRYLKYFSLRSG